MYVLVTNDKNVTAYELAKKIDVTQKTARFIRARLWEACSDPGSSDRLKGISKINECLIVLDRIADAVLNYHPQTDSLKCLTGL
jgi:hypothetical protein